MARPHGLRGQVVVELWTNRAGADGAGRPAAGPGGRAGGACGPARRPRSGGRPRWLVSFRGVEAREDAEALRGAVLTAPPAAGCGGLVGPRPDRGRGGRSRAGTAIGVVEAVEANPASDLLVLADGRLIPLRFVVDRQPGRLTVDLPPGLLEL